MSNINKSRMIFLLIITNFLTSICLIGFQPGKDTMRNNYDKNGGFQLVCIASCYSRQFARDED